MEKVKFRFAQKGDGALVLDFVKGLAAYEKLSSEVVATAEDMERELFEKKLLSFDCPKCGCQGGPTDIGKEFYIESIEIE